MSIVLTLGGDEISLTSLQDILDPFGHVLISFVSLEEAVSAVHARGPGLVLVDIETADFDAPAAIRALLKVNPGLALVAITNYPKEPTAFAALEAGAGSLMRKPFEIGRILKLLSGSVS